MQMNSEYHIPVLLNESVDWLITNPHGVYVDATFGGGSHSRAILRKLGDGGKLYAFDQDVDALSNVPDDNRFLLCRANFRFIKRFMKLHKVEGLDGIIADLGVSSHQLDIPERGFSYRFDAPLDMRMNIQDEVNAADILKTYSEQELIRVFSEFGEVRNSRTLAKAVVESRKNGPILSTSHLNQILQANCIGHQPKYFAQVYQALRMEVNEEVQVIKDLLADGIELLKPGGRLVVISYHSIEDRLVKNFIKSGNAEGELEKDEFGNIHKLMKSLTKKPIEPQADEQKANTRSRSAKMRVAEKLPPSS